jgi:UDP-3-O-[3-hydroxymyristoyl] glucosamine N-acyltransferase
MNDGSFCFRLGDLSDRFGLELQGNEDHEITGVGTLENAGPTQLSFLSNRAYRNLVATTRAGAVVLKASEATTCKVNCLFSDDPYVSFARIATLFDHRTVPQPGIHPSAVIDPTAEIGELVHIGPQVVIGAATRIGSASIIGPGCVIGANCTLDEACILEANVTLTEDITIGKRAIIHPGAVIGGDGFGLAFAGDHWEKVPQLGGVRIGDDCEIGSNTAIDRGAIEDTVLEDDVRLDNLVQIGHNVVVGAHTAIAGCAGIAGSTSVGRNCLIGGRTSIRGHLTIADGVTVAVNSEVDRDITEKGSVWSANLPAMPIREWQRNLSHLRKLDKIVKRIRELEK